MMRIAIFRIRDTADADALKQALQHINAPLARAHSPLQSAASYGCGVVIRIHIDMLPDYDCRYNSSREFAYPHSSWGDYNDAAPEHVYTNAADFIRGVAYLWDLPFDGTRIERKVLGRRNIQPLPLPK